ncbi:MAG: guanylate kinase [Ruminococcaceae bacterium]|nr:guanylate kinase [Oscillospiraceae bacterium]
MSKIIVVSGAAGSGKGTVLKEVFAMSEKIRLSVSCTTRKMRPGEQHGVNYYYISEEEFRDRLEKGDFIEHIEYCGNMYGTSRSYVEKMRDEGCDVVLEIETVGAHNVMKYFPDCISIFLAPPTYTVLEQRLRDRGTETEQKITERLERSKEELPTAVDYDYLVINRDGGIMQAAQAVFDAVNGCARESDIMFSDKTKIKEFINTFLNN